jgi:hypothetical protein
MSAVEKLLLEKVFRESGRYYFSVPVLCPRAYLERPRASLQGGRLKVVAHAVACGLETDIPASGIPFAVGTRLGLRDLRLDDAGPVGQALLAALGGQREIQHDFQEELTRWANPPGVALAWVVTGLVLGPPRAEDVLWLDATATVEVR